MRYVFVSIIDILRLSMHCEIWMTPCAWSFCLELFPNSRGFRYVTCDSHVIPAHIHSLCSLCVQPHVVHNCKRLAVEFLHFVIESRSLRKVFLSIKGIYYQAEVNGQTLTWITPYQFSQRVGVNVIYCVTLPIHPEGVSVLYGIHNKV